MRWLPVIWLMVLIGCQASDLPPNELYERGRMVERDGYFNEAVHLYRQAGQQDHVAAQMRLGLILNRGRIKDDEGFVLGKVTPNPEEAHYWFERAATNYETMADLGNVVSQVQLGWMHLAGWGMPRDTAAAFRWWRRAAAQDYSEAYYALGLVKYNLYENKLDTALTFINRAAEGEHPRAQALMSLAYQQGYGVDPDYETAIDWIFRAALNGDARSQRDVLVMQQ